MTHSYLSEISSWAAKCFGDRPAFVDPDGSILTYEDLDLRSTKAAAAMYARGLREGSVVGLTLGSYSQWVVAYVAASKLGAAIAAVNPRLTDFERSACLDKVDPVIVIESVDDVDRLVSEGSATSGFDPAAFDEARAAAIVFTSGTTGLPKGAVFTDRQLSAITRYDIGDTVGGDTPIAQYGSTQFAHVGFTTKLPWYLKLGTTTHLLERWKATDVLDLVERERISTIGGVAPQVALLLRDANFDERDLSAVKLLVMGGAMSPPALVEEARQRFDADYSIRWSSTESGGVGTSTAPGAPDSEALYTVGRPRPGMGLEIRDDEGHIVDPGSVGEVWLRSDATMSGYWRDEAASAETLVDGWLRTGDLGSVDETGCLTLAGRRGEMYIRGGYNVYPSEVAAVLGEHPDVDEVAVVARPHDVLGEIGVAIVVPTDASRAPSLDALRASVKSRLSHHKLPEALVIVDELPLTAMQKVDRKALERLAADQAP